MPNNYWIPTVSSVNIKHVSCYIISFHPQFLPSPHTSFSTSIIIEALGGHVTPARDYIPQPPLLLGGQLIGCPQKK